MNSSVRIRQGRFLEMLQSMTPRRPILVQHHLRQEWHPWSECEHEGPFLTRSVLLNEVIFDFDSPEWPIIMEEAGKLVRHLRGSGISFLLAHSGGKGLHVHIFLQLSAIAMTEDKMARLESAGVDPFSLIRVHVAEGLIAACGMDAKRAGIDWTKIRWSKDTKGSMIRDFGARRDDGRVKTLLDSIPPDRPSETEPQFPEAVEQWDIGNRMGDLEKLIDDKLARAERAVFRPTVDSALDEYPCYHRIMAGLPEGKRQLGAFNLALWNKARGVPESQAEADIVAYARHCEGSDAALERGCVGCLRGVYSRSYRGVSCEAVRTNLGEEFCLREECPLHKSSDRVIQRLMRLVEDAQAEPFLDERGNAYISIIVGGHRENHPIDSMSFRHWVVGAYWNRYQNAPHDQSLKNLLSVLSARAVASGRRIELSVRVAWHGDDIYLDLGDQSWSAVRISPGRWDVVECPPVLFRRTPGMLPLPRPERGDRVDGFLRFTRVEGRDRVLLPVLLTSYLVPGFPHPIAQFVGPPGSIKSTTAELMKNAIDPNAVARGGLTRSVEDFTQQFDQSHITLLDNLSSLPKEFSDRTCKAATGEAFMKRRLYTDDGAVVYKYMRCVLVTSIDIVNHSEDLLERSIIFRMEMLPDSRRRREEEVRQEFEAAHPRLLGAMLDAVAAAMSIKPTVAVRDLPRMADFAVWGEAISQAIGNHEGEFLTAYRMSLSDRNQEALRGHPVGLAILYLMEEQERFVGAR